MKYIKDISTVTLEVKQSKFIAWLTPYETYKTTLEKLKTEHPKARHFVTAYRYLNEYEQVVEHSSDDGEPKGTSGKPSLMVLQGQELINTAVVIVRYFGGIKLGTGGMARAYASVVKEVVSLADIKKYEKVGTADELKRLLYYVWNENSLKEIKNRGVNIEVYLGEKDKIVDPNEAYDFFKRFGTVYFIKNVGHILKG